MYQNYTPVFSYKFTLLVLGRGLVPCPRPRNGGWKKKKRRKRKRGKRKKRFGISRFIGRVDIASLRKWLVPKTKAKKHHKRAGHSCARRPPPPHPSPGQGRAPCGVTSNHDPSLQIWPSARSSRSWWHPEGSKVDSSQPAQFTRPCSGSCSPMTVSAPTASPLLPSPSPSLWCDAVNQPALACCCLLLHRDESD